MVSSWEQWKWKFSMPAFFTAILKAFESIASYLLIVAGFTPSSYRSDLYSEIIFGVIANSLRPPNKCSKFFSEALYDLRMLFDTFGACSFINLSII